MPYRGLLELSPDAILVNCGGEIVYANRAAAKLLAAENPDELVGTGALTYIHPSHHEQVKQRIARTLATGEENPPMEQVWVRRDGSEVVASVAGARVEWQGKPAVEVCLRKVDEHMRLQQVIEQERDGSLRKLANAIPQLAWMARRDGHIFWYNDRWYDYTGTTPQQMEGWGWRKVHHPDHVDRVVACLSRSWETGEPWEDTFPLRGKDGNYRWFLSRALPVHDEAGEVSGWFGTNTDVTELLQAKDALAEAAETKSRLISAVSHDLRQPLQSLTLFASLIGADPHLSPQSRVALDHLRASVYRMGDLLGSILSLAQIEAGLVPGEKKPVPLAPLLSDLAEEMAPQAHAKNLSLKFVPTSVVVEGDPTLLTTIVRNLVANAIRYTDRGKVLIGVRRQGTECLIAVYDTGAGIDADKLHLIWEEFYQVDNPSRDRSKGLGLGLSIVQRLTSLLDYKVVVKSVRGKGSAFCIVMPTTQSAADSSEMRAVEPTMRA